VALKPLTTPGMRNLHVRSYTASCICISTQLIPHTGCIMDIIFDTEIIIDSMPMYSQYHFLRLFCYRDFSPNTTWLVTSRHDTTRTTSVSSRACSNMADDEEAVVLACTSFVFCALDLHQSQEQLLEKVKWTCPPQFTLWRRPEHVSCESCLSRFS